MKLFLSGTTLSLKDKLNPTIARVKEFLDKSKNGELFSVKQIASSLSVHHRTILSFFDQIPSYSHKVANQRYWGKPSTIKQLIKETQCK